MPYETCPLLDELPWIKHGFFQRQPTVPFICTEKQSASPFLKELGVEGELYFNRHVFEDRIISPEEWEPEIKADAWITDQLNKGIAVKTADCVPLLLTCPKTRFIAAVHVSWHCVLADIVPKTINRMAQNGSDIQFIIAAIGPCIHQKSYPVGFDLYDRFQQEAPDKLKFFIPSNNKWLLDVPGMVNQQLTQNGVNQIWQSPNDVFTSQDHYSYRKRLTDPKSETMRNVSLIMKINP